ncbi:hypothetical protein SAZ_18755 [Streptomyces noursei ZPM]|uniref:Uncharacterized protein n=1 Tax=Streptomyces noursei TaxID=1971 RepID=A0A059W857_STRNR|nr:hypothetical protein [Streptomyces noursei]AKA04262.1 hypothetical protein SAZ_18755 [Streptomyces noursei ZPM]AIA04022.1 putative secreted protein [Streptomyces noursei]EOT01856.1 hypothetical protein K530_21658 [Streptomyces noursei CCRC 11814]EXU87958.1 hypothetical protein P354_32375 [Streptomyces noursei PD-1]UWS72654.1 hypothetical protein N1H47_16175 [Streptomyces noursei]
MSVTTLVLLLAAAVAVVLGAVALCTARVLRRQITALHAELVAARADATARAQAASVAATAVPAARGVPTGETPLADIRAAVADALAEERERELAEARAFWAAQEARESLNADAPSLSGPLPGFGDDGPLDGREGRREQSERLELDRFDGHPFVPRQADLAGLESLLGPEGLEPLPALEPVEALESLESLETLESVEALEALDAPEFELAEESESAELAAARRRHPSHPDFSPMPAVADHERTVARLAELAHEGTPLADVRPGPLGTLDVYVFADGTTLCLTPGDRETAESVAGALRDGHCPVLLGGSGISGAYALTFSWGERRDENVYILADRVIASL